MSVMSEGEQLAADYEQGQRLFAAGTAKTHCSNSQQEFGWEMAQEAKWEDEDDQLRESLDSVSIFAPRVAS